jgi:hypothetical protein
MHAFDSDIRQFPISAGPLERAVRLKKLINGLKMLLERHPRRQRDSAAVIVFVQEISYWIPIHNRRCSRPSGVSGQPYHPERRRKENQVYGHLRKRDALSRQQSAPGCDSYLGHPRGHELTGGKVVYSNLFSVTDVYVETIRTAVDTHSLHIISVNVDVSDQLALVYRED